VDHYGRAIELRPWAHAVRLALGQAQMELGDLDAAEATFKQVVASRPALVEPVLSLAFIAERTGRIERAIELYEQAAKIVPDDGEIRVRLGKAYLGVSRIEQAAKHFRAAITLAPGDPWAYLGLATCQRGAGHGAEAVRTLEEGLTACPGNVSLLNLLARVLATDPNDAVRNGPRAVTLARQACEATAYQGCLSLDTLAAAYAEVGDYDQAVATAERAARIAESQGSRSTAQAIRESVDRYRVRDPLRELQTNLAVGTDGESGP
jgi:tetratricopeptide (TPR) repeat protein